jgi:hypothetical protein
MDYYPYDTIDDDNWLYTDGLHLAVILPLFCGEFFNNMDMRSLPCTKDMHTRSIV